MRIGLLKSDSVLDEYQPEFGDYPDLFDAVFRAADPSVQLDVYDVERGHYPASTADADLFVMTGSQHSVYDEHPWIRRLEEFVLELHEERRKLFAVCFGHQMVGRILGGVTAKADVGWGIGVRRAEFVGARSWLSPEHEGYSLLMSHQDQVLELPPGAELLATSAYCPNQAFTVGEHILAVQGHPEFTPAYANRLWSGRRHRIGDENVDAAIATLGEPIDSVQWARWALAFARN